MLGNDVEAGFYKEASHLAPAWDNAVSPARRVSDNTEIRFSIYLPNQGNVIIGTCAATPHIVAEIRRIANSNEKEKKSLKVPTRRLRSNWPAPERLAATRIRKR